MDTLDGLGDIIDDSTFITAYDHLRRTNYDGTSSVIIAQNKKDMARLKKAYPGEKIVLASKHSVYPLPKDLKKVLNDEL